MQGSWVPVKGSFHFTFRVTTGGSESGYTFDPRSTKLSGVIVTKTGDRYGVTLVSNDGTRYVADRAVIQGAMLHVTINDWSFFLAQNRPNQLQWLIDVDGKPATADAKDLQPGSLPAAPSPAGLTSPAAP